MTDSKPVSTSRKSRKEQERVEKKARLDAALRANLRRRKAQAQGRTVGRVQAGDRQSDESGNPAD